MFLCLHYYILYCRNFEKSATVPNSVQDQLFQEKAQGIKENEKRQKADKINYEKKREDKMYEQRDRFKIDQRRKKVNLADKHEKKIRIRIQPHGFANSNLFPTLSQNIYFGSQL